MFFLFFMSIFHKKEKSKEIKIVTTTSIIKNTIEKITKDSVKIISLMGPGIDPHLYKATQINLKQLKKTTTKKKSCFRACFFLAHALASYASLKFYK